MKDLRDLAGVEFGEWSGQLPGAAKSYLVQFGTFVAAEMFLSRGYRVVVGNYRERVDGVLLSQVNSRFHGKSIRTIHAVRREVAA
jgi:hypothetical protein